MKVYDFDQYSPQWWAARRGIPTASAANKIITPAKGDLSAQSEGYLNQLLAERAGIDDSEREPTEHELVGREREPEARKFFEFDTGLSVHQVGFITNDEGTAGCSPDGLIWPGPPGTAYAEPVPFEEGWETKSPKGATHMGYLRGGILPVFYKPQVHFSLAVTGLNAWRFQSYVPGVDPLIVKVERDEYTEAVAKALAEFIDRLETESQRLGYRKAA